MIKRNLIIAVLCFLLPVLGKAQHLQFGVKLGANLSRLNGDNWEGGYKTNLLGGLEAGIYGKRFGISAEALFSQSTYETGDNFHDLYKQYYNNAFDSLKHGSFRVSYLNIPVLANVKLIERVWLQVGPQYSGVVGIKDKDELVHDAKELFKSGTVSGVAGLRVNLPFHLSAGVRYVFGLSDINKQSVGDTWRQSNIQISATYNFL